MSITTDTPFKKFILIYTKDVRRATFLKPNRTDKLVFKPEPLILLSLWNRTNPIPRLTDNPIKIIILKNILSQINCFEILARIWKYLKFKIFDSKNRKKDPKFTHFSRPSAGLVRIVLFKIKLLRYSQAMKLLKTSKLC